MFEVVTTPAAKRALVKLEQRMSDYDFQRLTGAIDNLAVEPRPQGVKKLVGKENGYRIRVGNYRIIYEIKDKELIVLVIQVSQRNEYTYDF